jgi:hypothetical protein
MSNKDTDSNTNDGGGLKKLFENKPNEKQSNGSTAQGMVTTKELVAMNVDKGIFKSIKDCAAENIVIVHPKKGEDEACKLGIEAKALRASKKFDEAQEVADQYKEKLREANIAKSAVQTLMER